MTGGALAAEGICVEVQGRQLLHDVSLCLRAGEVLALAGPNGAGKSTLLAVLAGDITPSRGRVTLDGRPITSHRARELARKRAVLPQRTVIPFGFTSRAIVLMGRHPHTGFGSPNEDEEAVDRAMQRTETLALAARRFPTLSGGEAQRVTIARVLAQQTPIVLLDEPTAALDIHQQALVAEIAREEARAGAAVLAVLHDLNLAAACADRVALMASGRIMAIGTPWQVLTPQLLKAVFQHPVTVLRHPARDCPLIVPLPRPAANARCEPTSLHGATEEAVCSSP